VEDGQLVRGVAKQTVRPRQAFDAQPIRCQLGGASKLFRLIRVTFQRDP
jgi:hypothetical protein